ncbi:MAG TPA: STAS domain-containing protein [Acidimicrobiia bacterium]
MTTGPKFQIEVGVLGDARLVTVAGEIDLAAAPQLAEVLSAEPESVTIADLRDVGFIDSTGLRSLMTAQDKVNGAGGRLALVYGEGPVERILDLTRLTDRFEVFASPEDAAQALG